MNLHFLSLVDTSKRNKRVWEFGFFTFCEQHCTPWTFSISKMRFFRKNSHCLKSITWGQANLFHMHFLCYSLWKEKRPNDKQKFSSVHRRFSHLDKQGERSSAYIIASLNVCSIIRKKLAAKPLKGTGKIQRTCAAAPVVTLCPRTSVSQTSHFGPTARHSAQIFEANPLIAPVI